MKKFNISLLIAFAFSTALKAQPPVTFNYTGVVQTYTVGPCVDSITVDVKGAQSTYIPAYGSLGGKGGRVQGTIAVTGGTVLYVYVGGAATGTGGGWNGGGIGASSYPAGGGAGASDIRSGGTALTNRIFVAGGGGGAGDDCSPPSDPGGDGGGLVGGQGIGCLADGGGGGTQASGGLGGNSLGSGQNGALGTGGNACSSCSGGGGGGGYYGGGGGAWGGGGGGSGYASSNAVNVTHTIGGQTGNGQVIITVASATAPPPPAPGAITGPSTVCPGATAAYSISSVSGATSYVWTAPAGATITGGTTTSVTITFGTTPGNISVAAANNCGPGAATTKAITLSPSPASGGISEPFTSTLGVFIPANGSNGNWIFANSCANSASSGHTGPGSALFEGSSCQFGNGGSAVSGNLDSPSIIIPASGGTLNFNYFLLTECAPGGSCFYDVLRVMISTNGGATYTSVLSSNSPPSGPGGLTTGSWINKIFSLSPYSGQTIKIRFNFNSGDGINNAFDGVYVDDVVVLTQGVNAGADVTICDGNSVTLGSSGGTVYNWSPATGLNNPNISNPTASPTVTTTYTVTVANSAGCTASDDVTVMVNPALAASVTTTSPICGNNDGSASVTPSGGIGTYTFLWSNGNTTSTVTGLNGQPTDTLFVTITDANGCTLTDTAIVECVTAVSQTSGGLNINISPNPSNGQFTIYNLENKTCDLNIYNMMGEKVYTDNIANRTSYVVHYDFADGMYFLSINTDSGSIMRKIVISK